MPLGSDHYRDSFNKLNPLYSPQVLSDEAYTEFFTMWLNGSEEIKLMLSMNVFARITPSKSQRTQHRLIFMGDDLDLAEFIDSRHEIYANSQDNTLKSLYTGLYDLNYNLKQIVDWIVFKVLHFNPRFSCYKTFNTYLNMYNAFNINRYVTESVNEQIRKNR